MRPVLELVGGLAATLRVPVVVVAVALGGLGLPIRGLALTCSTGRRVAVGEVLLPSLLPT